MIHKSIPHYTTKIGRNEVCPCGSKKKFKKCHGTGGSLPLLIPGKVHAQFHKTTPRKTCLAPKNFLKNCSKKIIDAHTISRSGSLSAIARDGHVYSHVTSVQSLSNGQTSTSLIGWRQASTFPGFCSLHDKRLFAPLEDFQFRGSRQQCCLLAYRSIAREFYAKNSAAQKKGLLHVLNLHDKNNSQNMDAFNQGIEYGLHDAISHKQKYDKVLESKNWNSVRAVLFEFDNIFPIQCAGSFFPEVDVFGNVVQVLGFEKTPPDVINIISFSANNRSFICFCWLKDSDISCSNFMAALKTISKKDLPMVLGSLIIQVSENWHFSPTWYEQLSSAGKQWCDDQMTVGLPFVTLPPPAKNIGLQYFEGLSVIHITEAIDV